MKKVCPILVLFLALFTLPLTAAPTVVAAGPLNEAGLDSDQILKWSADTITAAYTFDYKTMDQALQNIHSQFTEKAYREFKQSLDDSHLLQLVQTRKLDVTPVFYGQGEILESGVENGVYNWTIQIPLVLHTRGPYDTNKQKKLITIKIKRAALSEFSSGVAIDDFSSKDTR